MKILFFLILGSFPGVSAGLDGPAGDQPAMLPRKALGEISLAENGQANLVLVPPKGLDVSDPAIGGLRSIFRKVAGCKLPVMAGADLLGKGSRFLAPEARQRNLLVLGNLNTNPVMLSLAGRFRAAADARYPGGTGYVLRTIANPWGTGTHVIVVGASGPDGVHRGLHRLAGLLEKRKEPALPRLLEVVPGGDWVQKHLAEIETQRRNGSRASDASSPYAFAWAALKYQWTGAPIFLKLCRSYFDALKTPEPRVLPGQDYVLGVFLLGWRLIADGGAFSGAERQWMDQSWLLTCLKHKDDYWRVKGPGLFGSRHQTFGTLAFLMMTDYLLHQARPNRAARNLLERWETEGHGYYRNLLQTYRDDYDWKPSFDSAHALFRYALYFGDDGFFDSGMARLAALRAVANTDNMGWFAGTGPYEDARPGRHKSGIAIGWPLAITAFVYHDPQLKWLLKNIPGASLSSWGGFTQLGLPAYATGETLEPVPPADKLDLYRLPLSHYHYERLARIRPAKAGTAKGLTGVAEARSFDKLVFRDNWNTFGAYLILQGNEAATDRGDARTADVNCIIRFMSAGQIFLYHNNSTTTHYRKNGLFVSDGITRGRTQALAELRAAARFGNGLAMSMSVVPEFEGQEWSRSIFSKGGEFTLVMDHLRFRESRQAVVQCIWRSPAYAALIGPGEWASPRGEITFHLKNDGMSRMASMAEPNDGAARPFVLRQSRSRLWSSRETCAFQNVLYVTAPGKDQEYEIRRTGPATCLLRRSDGRLVRLTAMPWAFDSKETRSFEGPVLSLETSGKKYEAIPGNGEIKGRTTRGMNQEQLVRLWSEQRQSPHRRPASSKKSDLPKPARVRVRQLWRFAAFENQGQAIRGISATCGIPPNARRVEDLVDNIVPRWSSTQWPLGTAPLIEFDLGKQEAIAGIDIFGNTYTGGKMAEPFIEKKVFPAELTFSNDHFQADHRTLEVNFDLTYSIEPFHKGTLYLNQRLICRGLRQEARWVRFKPIFNSRFRYASYTEFIFRRPEPERLAIEKLASADLNGDGTDDVLLCTGMKELVALDGTNGTRLWHHHFRGRATWLSCLDVDSDGVPEVLTTNEDQSLNVFNADGKLRWRRSFIDQPQLQGDLQRPYSVCAWQPDKKGLYSFVVGHYHALSFLDPDGKVRKVIRCCGADQVDTLPAGIDLNGDGTDDTLFRNIWQHVLPVDGQSRETAGYFWSLKGPGIGFRLWRPEHLGPLRLLVVNNNGLQVFDPYKKKELWGIERGPVTDYALCDLNHDGREEVAVSLEEGFVVVYSAKGKRVAWKGTGARCNGLAWVQPGKRGYLAVATEQGLRILDENLSQVGAVDGNWQRVAVSKSLKTDSLLAVTGGGEVRRIEITR